MICISVSGGLSCGSLHHLSLLLQHYFFVMARSTLSHDYFLGVLTASDLYTAKVLLKVPDLIISFSECCHVYSTVISERRSCRLGTQNVFELGNQSMVCYNSMLRSVGLTVSRSVCGGVCVSVGVYVMYDYIYNPLLKGLLPVVVNPWSVKSPPIGHL